MKKVVESKVAFAKSKIWAWQREYFEEMGHFAWQSGEVPHYVTTNQRQANAYAEVLLAMRKDFAHIDAPIHIVELGAGSGKFAFFVLKRLQELCEWEGIDFAGFRYILTDFTQSNLDFWKIHPRLFPYFEGGLLDMALLDATAPKPLALQIGEGSIGLGELEAPVAVIANYLFDSIPQDLIFNQADGPKLCQSSLILPVELENGSAAEKLEAVEIEYSLASDQVHKYPEGMLNAVLKQYKKEAKDSFVLFPALGIRCLSFLKSLSQSGMVLLTADKGSHLLKHSMLQNPPQLAAHGSFSLNANYHALSLWLEQQGGTSNFPAQSYGGINTGCMQILPKGLACNNLRAAIHRHILELGPDSFYSNYRFLRRKSAEMELSEALAGLRIGLFDSHQLAFYAPAILKGASKAGEEERAEILQAVHRCWDNYYALAEDRDMALILGGICYELDAYEAAIRYFMQSEGIYGAYSGIYYNIAVCHYMLGNREEAMKFLEIVHEHDPANEGAAQIYQELSGWPSQQNSQIALEIVSEA